MQKTPFVIRAIIGFFILYYLGLSLILAGTGPVLETPRVLHPPRLQVKPKIDGILDEAIWQTPPLKKDFISYNPLYGEKLSYETLVWMAYDSKNLYFAFRCYDPEPQQIKTSLTSRDNMWGDDWVGLTLDPLGTRQTTYGFVVNPNGIQGDLLESTSQGADASPDFVWDSAGKITPDGYDIEICIPLRSIRFNSGKEVKMGVLFRRKVTRLGIRAGWPEIKIGQGVFNALHPVVYENLKKPLNIEILPSITYSSNREKIQPAEWGKHQDFKQLGIGFKYGLTSSITADITINPDFSQVESDAFQVEVNQRYPLFYTEKRPFFMEGIDIFSFFTIPGGFLPHAVHTRRIIDPFYGFKLTGAVGKIAFGFLTAGDEWPGQPWSEGINPHEDKMALFGIARGKYSLGKDNYIGILYSGREFFEEYNRVIGADIGFRLSKNQKINASFLQAFSKGDESTPSGNNTNTSNSSDFNFFYSYSTKPLEINAAFERIGKDFRMDSSFLRRSGIADGWGQIGYNFYPNSSKLPWLKRITPRIHYQHLHDLDTDMDDSNLNLGLDFIFIKYGYLGIDYFARKESWEGETFDLKLFEMYGEIQLTKWLQLGGGVTYGNKINYDAQPTYRGKGYEGEFFLVLQPNDNLNQSFSFSHSDLFKDQEKIYDVNIFYSHTTYQFNRYLFLRVVVQYDDYAKRMLTDFLASFTLIPGTVLHIGYGGLYEGREWQGGEWLYRQGNLLNIKRSFFLKVSYLWRF